MKHFKAEKKIAIEVHNLQNKWIMNNKLKGAVTGFWGQKRQLKWEIAG